MAPTRELDLGPTGVVVAANIKATRLALQMTISDLSLMLTKAGWPMNTASLSRLESNARRIDVDDLTAISIVLGVSPLALLLPRTNSPDQQVELTGSKLVEAAGLTVPTTRQLWQWAMALRPLFRSEPDLDEYVRKHAREGFRRASLPMWPVNE